MDRPARKAKENALQIQARVIGALILRDMRTRFGRSYLSFIIQVGWPLTHLMIMWGTFVVAHRIVPVGTDIAVFPATGILPYVLCLYPARMIMLAVQANKPLLMFSVVRSPDLILSRAILEIITGFCVFLIFLAIILPFDPDILPPDPATAMMAIFATLGFSVALGFLSAVIYSMFRLWLAGQIGILILMYLTSGALFDPFLLPPDTQKLIVFNPLFHAVGWLRSAYYLDYGEGLVSPLYLISVTLALLMSALLLERLMRGRILAAS